MIVRAVCMSDKSSDKYYVTSMSLYRVLQLCWAILFHLPGHVGCPKFLKDVHNWTFMARVRARVRTRIQARVRTRIQARATARFNFGHPLRKGCPSSNNVLGLPSWSLLLQHENSPILGTISLTPYLKCMPFSY